MMPLRSPKPPEALVGLQQWFSRAIVSPEAPDIQQAASLHLKSSNTLTPSERLDIYVKDYWPRCLESLAEDFPGLVSLLGQASFDGWMATYLERCPSRSYTLFQLGQDLEAFMQATYEAPDKSLIVEDVAFEWGLARAYFEASLPVLNPPILASDGQGDLFNTVFHFQPHVTLLRLEHDFVAWYKTLDSLQMSKPEKQETTLIIYRSEESDCLFESIDPFFFTILEALHAGKTIDEAIGLVSQGLGKQALKRVELALPGWFEDMVKKGWLSHPSRL